MFGPLRWTGDVEAINEVIEPLFRRVLGARFDRLHSVLQRVHDSRVSKTLNGRCDVETGGGWPARIVARAVALPEPARDVAVSIRIDCRRGHEIWDRCFGQSRMRTRLAERNGHLIERVGPIELTFSLQVVEEAIIWNIVFARAFGLRLPLSWIRKVTAREAVEEGRYVFDARAELPWLGLLVHYRGWLADG